MKEFIEKLIGRLEKKRNASDVKFDNIVEMNAYDDGVDDAIEIVNQLAEEYRQDLDKNSQGWIPCRERLPEVYEDTNTSDTVLVCSNDGFQWMAFWCSDGQWRFCECGIAKEPIDWTEIIAWQPLPAPYTENKMSEMHTDWKQGIMERFEKID